ncbi:N-acetylmuramate alpha-1-phosphate uridylyltransferase MurU [Thalassotalea atypica]|uniref:N-acetylmuramate alpha-1-phosphate uridylyltransferase MurU n=1 Tax=Thalassotalea atypica TaxID=2054316 RepID=UPI00257424D1|nr:nucleotidyltransferase family protein [Thalassotalea atypica]
MRAMILAAGRGERMRPLTDSCPKPLLSVAGKPLIVYHIEKLARIGITDIVINHAWLGQQIVDTLGDGSAWNVKITYSAESNGALETAGGIKKALHLLAQNNSESPFLVINGDTYFEYDFSTIPQLPKHQLAHLWLTENPEHNRKGDFGINNGILVNQSETMWTFSGLALYRSSFFNHVIGDNFEKLAPLLRAAADKEQIGASLLSGLWVDVGTPQRLQQLEAHILSFQVSGK